jgi:hypothetical protein
MIINMQQKTIWIGIIVAIFLSLFCPAAFALPPNDIEQRVKQLE